MNDSYLIRVRKDLRKNWSLYLIFLPVFVYYMCFCYKPMYGALIGFFNYKANRGMWASDWVGLKYFVAFFKNPNFLRYVGNTLTISVSSLVVNFPAPIILALLLNEVRNVTFKKLTQTFTYVPHFISLVIICGMIKTFSYSDGLFNDIAALFGLERVSMLEEDSYFVPIYVLSGTWSQIGWGSIIYLSALAGVDQQLYEAATIDGAGKLKQTWHVTIPGIMPIIIIKLILAIGSLMGVGYEKIINLYNESIYETAEVISTYVYRLGLQGAQYGNSTAIGLFNNVINTILVVTANKLSRKATGGGLW